jgi:hypothetical protein
VIGRHFRRYVKRILEDDTVATKTEVPKSVSFTVTAANGKASRFYITPKAEGVKTTSGGKPRPVEEVIKGLKTKRERRQFRQTLNSLGRADLVAKTL